MEQVEIINQINYCYENFETKLKIFSDNYHFKSLLKCDKFIKTIHPNRKPNHDINLYKKYHRYTCGYFNPNEKEICILFPELNKMNEVLFTMLHEYGHHLTYQNEKYVNYLLRSTDFINERLRGSDGIASDILFQDEINAWENAERWAIQHKFQLNKLFFDCKHYSLSTYNKEKTIKYFENI